MRWVLLVVGLTGCLVQFDETLLDATASPVTAGLISANRTATWFLDARGTLRFVGTDVSDVISAPTVVAGGPFVSVSSAGGNASAHVCAIDGEGMLSCWGNNGDGELGVGDRMARPEPTLVEEVAGWTHIEVGSAASCGIASGRLYCWGWNGDERLGFADLEGFDRPTQVTVDEDWLAVSLSAHGCGIRGSARTLECWGSNDRGQRGHDDPSPIGPVAPSDGWKSVTAGSLHTCAIDDADALWCWGDNTNGQLGTPADTAPVRAPAAIDTTRRWASVSGGGRHTCGISDGRIYCWGANDAGQTGIGELSATAMIAMVGDREDWIAVAAGDAHTCAIAADETLWCWGLNDHSQLGQPDGTTFSFPREVRL